MNDKLYDGRWQYIGIHNKKYQFKNVYNEQVIELSYRTYQNVINDKDTISHHISRIITGRTPDIHNSVQSKHGFRRFYHGVKRLSN